MKRLKFVLLLLGLLTIFSTAAFAVDVKLSGEYYTAGVYLDKTTLTDDRGSSTAFYFQRLRVQPEFIVAPGLKLVTRFDAMERAWGATRAATSTSVAADSAGTTAENENIAVDWAYINYQSPIGTFDVGMMNDGSTGTVFGNTLSPKPRIKYAYSMGPLTLKAAYTKAKESSYTALNNSANAADADNDKYGIEGVYKWKGGLAGLNINYYR